MLAVALLITGCENGVGSSAVTAASVQEATKSLQNTIKSLPTVDVGDGFFNFSLTASANKCFTVDQTNVSVTTQDTQGDFINFVITYGESATADWLHGGNLIQQGFNPQHYNSAQIYSLSNIGDGGIGNSMRYSQQGNNMSLILLNSNVKAYASSLSKIKLTADGKRQWDKVIQEPTPEIISKFLAKCGTDIVTKTSKGSYTQLAFRFQFLPTSNLNQISKDIRDKYLNYETIGNPNYLWRNLMNSYGNKIVASQLELTQIGGNLSRLQDYNGFQETQSQCLSNLQSKNDNNYACGSLTSNYWKYFKSCGNNCSVDNNPEVTQLPETSSIVEWINANYPSESKIADRVSEVIATESANFNSLSTQWVNRNSLYNKIKSSGFAVDGFNDFTDIGDLIQLELSYIADNITSCANLCSKEKFDATMTNIQKEIESDNAQIKPLVLDVVNAVIPALESSIGIKYNCINSVLVTNADSNIAKIILGDSHPLQIGNQVMSQTAIEICSAAESNTSASFPGYVQVTANGNTRTLPFFINKSVSNGIVNLAISQSPKVLAIESTAKGESLPVLLSLGDGTHVKAILNPNKYVYNPAHIPALEIAFGNGDNFTPAGDYKQVFSDIQYKDGVLSGFSSDYTADSKLNYAQNCVYDTDVSYFYTLHHNGPSTRSSLRQTYYMACTQLKPNLPIGNYYKSCASINYDNGVLSAKCATPVLSSNENKLNTTSLDYSKCAAGSSVINDGGNLVCSSYSGQLSVSGFNSLISKIGDGTMATIQLSDSVGTTSPVTVYLDSNSDGLSVSPATCTLTTNSNSCTVNVVGNRAGVYTLTASARGYSPVVSDIIVNQPGVLEISSVPNLIMTGNRGGSAVISLKNSALVAPIHVSAVSNSEYLVLGSNSCDLSQTNNSCSIELFGKSSPQVGNESADFTISAPGYESVTSSSIKIITQS